MEGGADCKEIRCTDLDAIMKRSASSVFWNILTAPLFSRKRTGQLLMEYMDINSAITIVDLIIKGEIHVALGPHSLIGAGGLLSSRDQIPPPTADKAVIETLKRRLAQDDVVLVCMNCRDWKSRTVVSRVPTSQSVLSAGPVYCSAQTVGR